jgi:hypothetical protein
MAERALDGHHIAASRDQPGGVEVPQIVQLDGPRRSVEPGGLRGCGTWRGPRPYVSGATAMHTMPIKRSDPYEGGGGAYARRYHGQKQVNEVGHTRRPVGVVPAAVCWALT